MSEQAMTREILTVAQLNRAVASLFERSVPPVWVSGEISNLTRATSGHYYFSLKDSGAQVRAVMFRGRAQYLDFSPRDGDQVEVRALVTLYEPRGDYQLNVEMMRRAGAGDLYQRFLALKARLQGEGLFDAERKRPLPALPRQIGIITSLQAAALRDVLTTLTRRAPQIPVVIYPSPVQGSEAPAALIAALQCAIARAECDVLLLVRGGGSIEDLWAFNDERLARALAASPIPIVCGVGHETDFTIADFVADLRAPTPTAAAEQAAPDRRQLIESVFACVARLRELAQRRFDNASQQLDLAVRLLRPPSAQWALRARQLEALGARLASAQASAQTLRSHRLDRLTARLRTPDTRAASARLDSLSQRLLRAGRQTLERRSGRLEHGAAALALVSPQAVLERGYAIVTDEHGQVLRQAAAVSPGADVQVSLARGELIATVRQTVASRLDSPATGPDAG